MSRALAAASIVMLGAIFAPAPAAASPQMDQGWMTPGRTLALEGLSVDPLGAAFAVEVVVDAATPDSITFHWAFLGETRVVVPVTYDRATRMGPGGGALLWVNPSDVEARAALFGDRPGVLVLSTPAFHQFYADGQHLFFSAATGLLLRAEDVETGGILVMAGDAAGQRIEVTPDAGQGVAFSSAESGRIVAMPPQERDFGEHVALWCAGRAEGAFGGPSACDPATYWVFGDYTARLAGRFPLLGAGVVRAVFSDMYGETLAIECRAPRPAASALDIHCVATPPRAAFAGIHLVRVESAFTHCLDPRAPFACAWEATAQLKGGVWR